MNVLKILYPRIHQSIYAIFIVEFIPGSLQAFQAFNLYSFPNGVNGGDDVLIDGKRSKGLLGVAYSGAISDNDKNIR
jgi:hypothetical protein